MGLEGDTLSFAVLLMRADCIGSQMENLPCLGIYLSCRAPVGSVFHVPHLTRASFPAIGLGTGPHCNYGDEGFDEGVILPVRHQHLAAMAAFAFLFVLIVF